MSRYRVKKRLNSSKLIQCFNPKNSSHGIYYCESFTESKSDVKYVSTVKSTTCRYVLSEVVKCLEQNI